MYAMKQVFFTVALLALHVSAQHPPPNPSELNLRMNKLSRVNENPPESSLILNTRKIGTQPMSNRRPKILPVVSSGKQLASCTSFFVSV